MRGARGFQPAGPILIGVSVMLGLGMGLRQSLGLFMPPLTRDIAVSVADFTLAVAVQNLAWGLLQPVAGAWVVRLGFRPVLVAGAALYAAGLLTLAAAHGAFAVMVGAGLLVGTALACTGQAMAMAVAARAVPDALRSTVLGVVTAAGSVGALIAAPVGQGLTGGFGWRGGVLGFAALALAMVPAAWLAGRIDRVALAPARPEHGEAVSAGAALSASLRNAPFMVMTGAYFVCGLQLVFLTTHLPAYLALCGMDPMLSAEALGVIGGFNVLGSLFFGWAGGRWPKRALLGAIYTLRSLGLLLYFMAPPTPLSTLVFAGVMGFLWLGVGPLIAGSVVELFGLRWQAMIQGIAFMSHQLGSFVGAFGAGLLFDALGSYDAAWRLIVAMGLAAGVVQLVSALPTPPRRVATG